MPTHTEPPGGIGFDDRLTLARWIDDAVARRWPDAHVTDIATLKGDASNRRFWRVTLVAPSSRAGFDNAPTSAIAIDLGPDDLPTYVRALKLLPGPLTEPPFLNTQRFLKSIGSAVPDIYVADAPQRMLLVEDVGETPLFEAALAPGAKPASLYRIAIDELLLIHVEGTRQLDRRCVASSVAYDARLFRWEMNDFLALGAAAMTAQCDPAALAPELDDLATRLGALPRVVSHRDYHGHNLFVQGGPGGARIRVIDFQDALLAPAAQDLAVLLTTRDTDRAIGPAAERRLLDYYLAGCARRGAACPDAAVFAAGYRLCVLQHALKVIGRFNALERQGKRGYAAFIPHAIAQARRMLAGPRMAEDFPQLRRAFDMA